MAEAGLRTTNYMILKGPLKNTALSLRAASEALVIASAAKQQLC